VSSPYINHFIQPDTIIPNPSNPQSLNRYSYVSNRPVNFNDPTGHIACSSLSGVSYSCPTQGYETGVDIFIATQENNTNANIYVATQENNANADIFVSILGGIIGVDIYVPTSQNNLTGGFSPISGNDLLRVITSNSLKRPSNFRKNVRDEVWENAKDDKGDVRDPGTKEIMDKNMSWDMGHKPGYEFRKLVDWIFRLGKSRKDLLNKYNDPKYYRPETPSTNRSHKLEDSLKNLYDDEK